MRLFHSGESGKVDGNQSAKDWTLIFNSVEKQARAILRK